MRKMNNKNILMLLLLIITKIGNSQTREQTINNQYNNQSSEDRRGYCGLQIMMRKDYIVVRTVDIGGPCFYAGVKPLDIIMKVNGVQKSGVGISYLEAVESLKGDIDTWVTLTILRESSYIDFKVKRIPLSKFGSLDNNSSKEQIISTYDAIIIGNQEWMKQNLNVEKFRNGDPIPQARSKEEWEIAQKEKKPAWCYFENIPQNGELFGKLYNWYAVNDPRGLAPIGWHIPTKKEWDTLIKFLCNQYPIISKDWMTGETYHNSFDYPITNARVVQSMSKDMNNSTKFSAIASGSRESYGEFFPGRNCCWWSADEFKQVGEPNYITSDDRRKAYYFDVSHPKLNFSEDSKGAGISVRCVKD